MLETKRPLSECTAFQDTSLVIAPRLLPWYDRHARELPWRKGPQKMRGSGDQRELAVPYHVWLSEIMLQQTTVATVKAYFLKFLAIWPTVEDLAQADLDQVLTAWAGLGYYARARNLHRCAQVVAEELDGIFPDNEAALLKLPGVGPYTAAAIAAIAFDRPAAVVDGNVERVIARFYALQDPLPGVKTEIRTLAAKQTPQERSGDYAQAMMDLGATICTPRNPACVLCPIQAGCLGREKGIAAELPKKAPKKLKPIRRAFAYLFRDEEGSVLLRRRAESGLLGGMVEVPSGSWGEAPEPERDRFLDDLGHWSLLEGQVKHTFTHFHFEISLLQAKVGKDEKEQIAGKVGGSWHVAEEFSGLALPTVMKKILYQAV
ncbi:A/G-specific adenine glycosylase [Kiloniella laminariae]|uniref:Adenine DNA glycosylase n=1 Tax=Kiloniella laminariae TaxID=454162 RepID=A0ABT4LL34_9PROT|nr:A/G-specific adenine glycosylase [Kiloniella laminariae]MCZ4281810.1 A/G-specific adenine glycosylase [Kiloniella laminariae]